MALGRTVRSVGGLSSISYTCIDATMDAAIGYLVESTWPATPTWRTSSLATPSRLFSTGAG